jgi:PAS domain S-box-containing protein
MKTSPARIASVLLFALLGVLALATLESWNGLRELRQTSRSTAALDQSAADAVQISVAVQAATTAALTAAQEQDATALQTYGAQRQLLQNTTGRLQRDLRDMPALAEGAGTLQRQTRSLLESLDALTTQSPQADALAAMQAAGLRELANQAQANAESLHSAVQSRLAVADQATVAAALTQTRRSLLALVLLVGLTLAVVCGVLARATLSAKAASKLHGAATRNTAIVGSSPLMVLTCGLDGTVRSLNPAAERLLADNEASVLARGNKLRDFLVAGEALRLAKELDPTIEPAAHDVDLTDQALITALRQHWETTPLTELHQWPLKFRCSDGSSFTRMASIAPLADSSGALNGFFVMAGSSTTTRFADELIQEIEDQSRHVFDLNHQKESILNATAEGIFGLDPAGATLFANPAAVKLLQSEPDQIVSRNLHSLLHGNRPGGLSACAGQCGILRALASSSLTTAQDMLFHADGSTTPIEFSASPMLEYERNVGTVFSLRDISQREALDRLKDEFVSTVSHELRTPLTSIRGALGLLSTGRMGEMGPKAMDLLRIALNNTDRLVRLINDVLDLERMQSGSVKLEFKTVDLCDLIGQSVETMRPMAESAGVHIQSSAERCYCQVDADRILQVFTNLFSNAIKFSPPGSTVTLSLSPGDEILSVAVSDQGRGIPDQNLETIFDRFQQVDASDSRQKGGTGLGLAICRTILQQHGGRIWAEKNQPIGTTFRMVIPRSQVPNTQAMLEPKHDHLPLLQQTILVCDDDPIARTLVRHHLQQQGYQVLEAESGEQALAMARQPNIDAILLDLFMPGMNGWETLQKLKSDPATSAIPVVILSVFSSRQFHGGEDMQDIQGWVNKPFNQHSLLSGLGPALKPEMAHILLVENDDHHAATITATFERSGLVVHRALDRQQAIQLCQALHPQLMVLNLSLPGDGGMQLVAWLRQHNDLHTLPLFVYSGREISNAELELITQGPAQFLERARVQPAEIAQLVLTMLERRRNGIDYIPGTLPLAAESGPHLRTF